MSWQAFTWTEIHAKAPRVPDRYVSIISGTSVRVLEVVSLAAEFLRPFAAIEAALGLWRLGADLGWAGAFFVNRGMFSHWQVWIAMSIFTQVASVYLNRVLPKKVDSVESQA